MAPRPRGSGHIMQTALSDSGGIVLTPQRTQRGAHNRRSVGGEGVCAAGRCAEINDYHGSKRAEADALIQTARLTSEELVEEARHEAGSLLGRARREHTELERRLAQLRTAISSIEDQFRHLSESTLEQTEIMASMISLEGNNLEEVSRREEAGCGASHPASRMTIDLTGGDAGQTRNARRGTLCCAARPDNLRATRRGNSQQDRRGEGAGNPRLDGCWISPVPARPCLEQVPPPPRGRASTATSSPPS